MVVMPPPTAATIPAFDTVATDLLVLVHVTVFVLASDGATVAVSCCVLPLIIVAVVGETVIPDVGVVTTTVHDAVFAPSAVVAVIVAVPLAFAVTRPDEFTVATLVLLLLQE